MHGVGTDQGASVQVRRAGAVRGAPNGRATDLTGLRFGRLTVLRRGSNTQDRPPKPKWICVCECNPSREIEVRAILLKGNRTRSCGCLARDLTRKRSTTHGKTKSPEWETWRRMKARCYNKRSDSYPWYGQRGIRVCERWLSSFTAFLSDMGSKPGPEFSIERKRVNEDYGPDNCIWATIDVQSSNKRSNRKLRVGDKEQTAAQWARDLRISQTTVNDRLGRGWSIEEAVTTAKGKRTRWRMG